MLRIQIRLSFRIKLDVNIKLSLQIEDVEFSS